MLVNKNLPSSNYLQQILFVYGDADDIYHNSFVFIMGLDYACINVCSFVYVCSSCDYSYIAILFVVRKQLMFYNSWC